MITNMMDCVYEVALHEEASDIVYLDEQSIHNRDQMKTSIFNVHDTQITYYIGRTAAENTKLIKLSSPDDLWFHLKHHPSCHVICRLTGYRIKNKKMMRKIVKYGAVLCKSHSKQRSQRNIEVSYAHIRHVSPGKCDGQAFACVSKEVII